ncbi:MAG TPA: hypothetical protein PLH92_07400 [Mycobacterium sp.]|nr:hypothetical protein [Mycobacterium sp.]HQC76528.1 hypothetical protein [Mycobacterium sp.]
MNYTVLVMTMVALILGVFLPLSALAYMVIKSSSRSDEFGLGTVTLQDELHNFLAEFEGGAPAADKWS